MNRMNGVGGGVAMNARVRKNRRIGSALIIQISTVLREIQTQKVQTVNKTNTNLNNNNNNNNT